MNLGCEDNSSGHRLAPAQPEEKWASHKCFQFNYSIPYHRTIFKSQPVSGWDKRGPGWCSCKAAKIWAGEQDLLLFVHLHLVPFPLADSLREWRVHHPPRSSRRHLLYNQQRKGEFTPSQGKGLPKSLSSLSFSTPETQMYQCLVFNGTPCLDQEGRVAWRAENEIPCWFAHGNTWGGNCCWGSG